MRDEIAKGRRDVVDRFERPHGFERPAGDVVTQPCSEAAHFDIPYPAGSTVSVEIGGREVATEKVVVKDLLVVGMGDSFASGEGNPDVPVRFSRDRSADSMLFNPL